MMKSAQWFKLVGAVMVLAVCAAGVSADEPQPAPAAEPLEQEVEATVESDVGCVPVDAFTPVFTTVLDQVQQRSCGCRDQCFSDFQCVQQNGPGSACVPVGPCGCKECTATS